MYLNFLCFPENKKRSIFIGILVLNFYSSSLVVKCFKISSSKILLTFSISGAMNYIW
jgi:hypothetical protein